MANVRLIGIEDQTIDFTFSTNPEKSIDFKGLQKWASHPVPRQEGSVLQDMGGDALEFSWSGVLDGDNAFADIQILDAIRLGGSPVQLHYLEIQIPCVIKELNFKFSSPNPGALDRWFYEIKFQKYYPWLSVSRTSIIDSSLTGQEIATLTNKTIDCSTQVEDLQVEMSTITSKGIINAVGDVIDTVSNALDSALSTLDDLRQGIQTPLTVIQMVQQELADASTQVKQAILEVDSIYNTPSAIANTMRDMTVSLDFLATAPFIQTTDVLTILTEDGDTLEDLAAYAYGSFETWRIIYSANRALIPDPNLLLPGLTLVIPQ